MRNWDELNRRIQSGEILSREEMEAKYWPLRADYQAVADWLKSEGLTLTAQDPSHLAVFARGSVSRLAKAFQTNFARVSLDGAEYTSAIAAPSVPTGVASSDSRRQRPAAAPEAASALEGFGPRGPGAVARLVLGSRLPNDRPATDPRFTRTGNPNQLAMGQANQRGAFVTSAVPGSRGNSRAQAFIRGMPFPSSRAISSLGTASPAASLPGNSPPVLPKRDSGSVPGVRLDERVRAEDRDRDQHVSRGRRPGGIFVQTGTTPATVEHVQVVPGTLPAGGTEDMLEATLDVEWSSAMAPGATIRVYATQSLAFVDIG